MLISISNKFFSHKQILGRYIRNILGLVYKIIKPPQKFPLTNFITFLVMDVFQVHLSKNTRVIMRLILFCKWHTVSLVIKITGLKTQKQDVKQI